MVFFFLIEGFQHSCLLFRIVADNDHKIWGKYGLQKVFLRDKGMFVFKFSSPDERDNVFALGPQYISNKLLIIQKWKEGMDVLRNFCTKAPVLVKFHHVHVSY